MFGLTHIDDRFTPTGVGKPEWKYPCRRREQVHPHRCGETPGAETACGASRGSPPQVWGNLFKLIFNFAASIGSPPQVWGNLPGRPRRGRAIRFTPTGVGKPGISPAGRHLWEVHPHRCGETSYSPFNSCPITGSPPQVWGNPRTSHRPSRIPRFTPTGVGKPHRRPSYRPSLQVHPHRCGETVFCVAIMSSVRGSPPQVWGNLMPTGSKIAHVRFTPTGVGKPRIAARFVGCREVHPHRCGETRRANSRRDQAKGSPPQVWGNHFDRLLACASYRFTPTGVGKPLALPIDIPCVIYRFTPTGVGKPAPAHSPA